MMGLSKQEYIIIENGHQVLYVMIMKPLNGMLMLAVRPYDIYVANQIANGKSHTAVWHVNDIKSSHADLEVNNKVIQGFIKNYANDEVGKIKYSRDKMHPYLGMTLDYSTPSKFKINMTKYIDEMIDKYKRKSSNATD